MRGLVDFLAGVVLFICGIVSSVFFRKYKLLFFKHIDNIVDKHMECRLKSFKNEMEQDLSKFF